MMLDTTDLIQLRRLTGIQHPDPLPPALVSLYKRWHAHWNKVDLTDCHIQVLCLMVALTDGQELEQPKASDRMARARAAKKRAKAASQSQTEPAPELVS